MKDVLIHIDNDLTSGSILKALERIILGGTEKIQITLLKIYMVSDINNVNAVEENDRIKAHLGIKISKIQYAVEEYFLGSNLVVQSRVEIGSKLNVLPSLLDSHRFDCLIIGYKSVALIPKIKYLLSKEKNFFPYVILCPETIECSILEA
jgi:hypothetical protein